MDCGCSWVVWFPAFFQRLLRVTLHRHNGRQMPAVRAAQGDCERVYRWVLPVGCGTWTHCAVYLRGTNRANSANKSVWIHPPHPGRIYINRTNTQYLALVGLLRVYCAYYDEKLPWGVESSYSINAWHITPHICAYVYSCLWSCDNF